MNTETWTALAAIAGAVTAWVQSRPGEKELHERVALLERDRDESKMHIVDIYKRLKELEGDK